MIRYLSGLFFLFLGIQLAAQPAYYSGIDFTQSGPSVRYQLSDLITNTHNTITYSECWNVLKVSDLETGSTTDVLLIYGYNDGDGNPVTDRTRDKNLNGGNVGEWNREHVYPKSLGSPDLGTSGPGSDAHNLRASDVQQNGNRGNKKYADGSGNAGDVGAHWYPGDEFKGDCARIIMYMYLRYGAQCLPKYAGVGTESIADPNMIDLFLEWNAEDPVSQFEEDRNNAIYNVQSNRNPFIDNPAIATKIWGGPEAEETWEVVSTPIFESDPITLYPMPVDTDLLYISGLEQLELENIQVLNISGQLIEELDPEQLVKDGGIAVDDYQQGTYIVNLVFEDKIVRKKVVIE